MPLIEARNVSIRIPTDDGTVHAANDVSFSVEPGALFGIAGESGSGKSVLSSCCGIAQAAVSHLETRVVPRSLQQALKADAWT